MEDADALTADGQAKMEDLRLGDPDETTWMNITEVKGHNGGGKTRDMVEMNRFVTVYTMRNGAPPNSKWYVVNQFRDRDPGARPALLAGGEEDLVAFGADGGSRSTLAICSS